MRLKGKNVFGGCSALIAVLAALCIMGEGEANAYAPYYNMQPDDHLRNKILGIEDIIDFAYDWKGEDFVGYILPSQHEAIIYRAIAEMCGGPDNIEDCWIAWEWLEDNVDLADDDEFWGCLEGGDSGYYQENGFSDASDANANCNVIGRNGLEKDVAFRSLLAGSRWPDLKGMPAMMADNSPDLYGKNAHNNPTGQAGRSSSMHTYIAGAVDSVFNLDPDWAFYDVNDDDIVDEADVTIIRENDEYKISTSKDGELYQKLSNDKASWEPDPDGEGEMVDRPEDWVKRQQAYLTATAAFIVDRFLQAQDAVIPDSPYHINQYYKVEQDFGFFWEIPCLVAAGEIEMVNTADCTGLCAPFINPLDPSSWVAFGLCIAACEAIPDAGDCILAVALDSLYNQGRTDPHGDIGVCMAGLALGNLFSPLFGADIAWFEACRDFTEEDSRDGESLLVNQAPFFTGQAIHTIEDSFAHAVRDYDNPIFMLSDSVAPILQIRRTGGDIRSAGDTDQGIWSMSHSICYDHDCKFGIAGDEWRFSDYTDTRIYGDDNAFGSNNREMSAHVVSAFLHTSAPDNFQERWLLLREFIKKWFSMEIPEEMLLDAGGDLRAAPYNLNGRLCNDYEPYPGSHPSLETPPSGYPGSHNTEFPFNPDPTGDNCAEGYTCDPSSGICRKGGCVNNADCLHEGSVCGQHGFCYMKWDPWDLAADQSFLKMGEDPSTSLYESDSPGQSTVSRYKNVSEQQILDARHWYFIERHEKNSDIKGRITAAIENDCQESPVIVFHSPGYDGDIECAPGTSEGQMDISDVQSFYVKEHRKVCFIRNYKNDAGEDEEMCFYGGINGTTDNFLMPPWGTHRRLHEKSGEAVKAVRWSMADVEEDGVLDADDNCMFFSNADQADMDSDGMGDVCDPDRDGDGVLEDNGGPGAWFREDEVINPCRGRLSTDYCDDNCKNIYNPDQGDCDEDGIGDLCDIEPVEVECPKDIVTSECEGVNLGKVTIVDEDCSQLINEEDISNNAPAWYELGETDINWWIKNPSGVYSQCTQTVTRIVANDYFVDDNAQGANNGSSWEDAFLSLHSALDPAEPGDVIWVKEGMYNDGPYPLKTGVEVYGGFDQSLTETCGSEDKRDVRGHVSYIESNNAGICLMSAQDGHMDGFTVQHCNGTNGGAIQITDSGIVFSNMLFQENQSPNGGVINNESDTSFYNCEFSNNTSSNGGAIRNAGEIYCDTCVFKNNYGSNGGAVADGTGVFIDSLFEGNSSNNGGAMNNVEGEFESCQFISNHSYDGGAMTGVQGEFQECTFMYNSAINGGAVHQSQGTFTDCQFLYNYAETNGGAIADASGIYVNCIIADNVSDINGGGISGGNTNFTNCTVANNTAGISGGGIGGDAAIKNSIVFGNSAGTWADQINGSAQVTYSDIEDGWSGVGNIDANPLFQVTARSAYELQSASPCIDAADTSIAPSIDIFGTSRIVADMGAIEYLEVTWVCGDGVSEQGELCDDGNTIDGDGCSATCEIEPTCKDLTQNQDETDTDCGGAVCDGCDDGLRCIVHRDCLSGYCNAGICSVPLPSCHDDEVNGDETDLNCGGSCPGCEVGQQCTVNADCVSENCDAGICEEPIVGVCTIAAAVDLGAPGQWVTVPNNGCVKVQSGYPDWWDTRTMQIQPDRGTYPILFDWSNTCSGKSGTGTFNYNWDNRFIGPVNESCATLISLHGSGTGNITLRYYGL